MDTTKTHEPNKGNHPGQDRSAASGPGQKTTSSPARPAGGGDGRDQGVASQITGTAKDIAERGADYYEQGKQAVTEAYEKTSEAMNQGYDQAITYTRENPARAAMICFGVGVGVGLLMAASGGRRSRGRYTEPVVNALTDIAYEYFRR